MFFYIGEQCDLLNKAHDGLFLDNGWEHPNDSIWIKGYSTDCILNESINDITTLNYQPRGIWAVIEKTAQGFELYHSPYRGFPIYKGEEGYCNFFMEGHRPSYLETSYEPDTTVKYSLESGAKEILNILTENLKNTILYNKHPLELIYTGGIDSLTLWAVLDSITKDYKLQLPLPLKSNMCSDAIPATGPLISQLSKMHWGYKVMDDYPAAKNLITGYYGDEFLFRNPTYQIGEFAHILNFDLYNGVQPEQYMYSYIRKKKNYYQTATSREQAISSISKRLKNDYQIWHFNNVTHICPYYDFRIFEVACGMPTELILEHGLDATIQRKIIEICNPDFAKLLDIHKNNGETRYSNLIKFWDTVPALSKYKLIS